MMMLRSTRAPESDRRQIINTGVHYSWGGGTRGFVIWNNKRPHDHVATFDAASRFDAWQRFKSLESEAQERRRRRASSIARWGRRLAFVGLPMLAAGLLVVMLVFGAEEPDVRSVARSDAAAAGERFKNVAGDYRLRLPAGWIAEERSTATEVRSPDHAVTVLIEMAPDGDIVAVSPAVFETLTAAWTDVHLEAPLTRRIGGAPRVSVGGTATDGSGESVRFLAIALDAGVRNFAISVSVPQDWYPVGALSEIDQIVGSLKTQTDP